MLFMLGAILRVSYYLVLFVFVSVESIVLSRIRDPIAEHSVLLKMFNRSTGIISKMMTRYTHCYLESIPYEELKDNVHLEY